eukprot:NODE_304_length_1651_cov_130.995006_g228_i0.p1 GENE.NODE_304_length_1651_cov_130.995006_g228_i0~~NODE_304_length_1651_cov_130.995006_g228_i0.p1  ORF type:complete len:388 (-),score=51.80 NODE_304_length_1651_cov_130.995006_g228_i0:383-1546(-)
MRLRSLWTFILLPILLWTEFLWLGRPNSALTAPPQEPKGSKHSSINLSPVLPFAVPDPADLGPQAENAVMFLLSELPSEKSKAQRPYFSLLMNALTKLEKNLLLPHGKADVLIFYVRSDEVPMTEKLQELKALPFVVRVFEVVNFTAPPIPRWKWGSKTGRSIGGTCLYRFWPVNYGHMSRWMIHTMFRQDVFGEYRYILRLDCDGALTSPPPCSPWEIMDSTGAVFGYYSRDLDTYGCVQNLLNATLIWADINNVKPKHITALPEGIMYFGNFGIFRTSWWRTQGVMDYMDFVLAMGGIYGHRWTEQDVYPMVLGLFVDTVKVHQFGGFHYTHNGMEIRGLDGWAHLRRDVACAATAHLAGDGRAPGDGPPRPLPPQLTVRVRGKG